MQKIIQYLLGRKNFKKNLKSQHFLVDNLNLPSLRIWCYLPLILFLIMGLFSCGNPSSTKSNPQVTPSENTDTKITFFGVALEQFDPVGKPLWKVQAQEAKYTTDKKIGAAKSPQAQLYQDGKIVYYIKANQADILQDGKQLFLKGEIVATDPRNGIVLMGNELEWRPEEDLLIIRNKLRANRKNLQAVAKEARAKTREEKVELLGGVVATSSKEPQLKVQTESLIWQVKEDKLIGDRLIKIQSYQDNKLNGYGQGNGAEIHLKSQIVTLKPQAQLNLIDPSMQVNSNSLTWNIPQKVIESNAAIKVVHNVEKVTVTGNQGTMKIADKIVDVTGNVQAIGERKQSLKSDKLTWYLEKKLVEAQGNVFYKQNDPELNFQGQTAIGNLQTEDITVKGGNSANRVITEIIPNDHR